MSPAAESHGLAGAALLRCPAAEPAALPAAGLVLLAPEGAPLDPAAVREAERLLTVRPELAAVIDLPPLEAVSPPLALLLDPLGAGALLARAERLRACGGAPDPADPLGCARAALRLATAFEIAPSQLPLAAHGGPRSGVATELLGGFARQALRRFSLEDLYPALRRGRASPAAASADLASRLYAQGRTAEAVAVAHHAQTLAEGRDPGTDLRWSRPPAQQPGPRPPRVSAPPPAPLVSFVVTTLDRPVLLARSLESIAAQIMADCEAIVVNDAGADPLGALAPFRSTLGGGGRVTLVHHDRNRGLAAARNTGLRLARGRYVGFLDDDDRLLPHHLEALLPRLRLGARVVHGDVRTVHESAAEPFAYAERSEIVYQFDYHEREFHVGNCFPVHALLCERSLLEAAGGFDESLPVLEDWDLWLRVFRLAPPQHVPRITAELRKRPAPEHLTGRSQDIWLEVIAHVYEKTLAAERADPALRALRVQSLLELSRELDLPFPHGAPGWLRGEGAGAAIDPQHPHEFLRGAAGGPRAAAAMLGPR